MTEVIKSLSAIQITLSNEGIPKSRRNQQQNYDFRGIDDVYEVLAPLLAAQQLLILPNVVERHSSDHQSKSGGTLFYTSVLVDYEFISAKDDSKHVVRSVGEAMDSGDKSTNKAMSAAYKTMAIQAFCIRTTGDNDSENSNHEVGKAKPAQKPATEQAKQSDEAFPNCPDCKKNDAVIKSRYDGPAFVCYKNRAGCGKKFDN